MLPPHSQLIPLCCPIGPNSFRIVLPSKTLHLPPGDVFISMSHFDDSDSDSASEPDLDDPPFVPDPVDDSEPDVLGSPPPSPSPSPSASPDSTPEPLPPSDEPGPSASSHPHQSESPTPPSDSQDSRDSPAPSEPYKTRSGRSSRPVGEWWKVNHPYQQAKENRRTRRSGRTPDSANEAAIAALEEANSVRTLSDSELIEYAFLTSNTEPRTYKEAMSRDDAGLWHKASQEEYNALLEHGVWELCELLALGSWLLSLCFGPLCLDVG